MYIIIRHNITYHDIISMDLSSTSFDNDSASRLGSNLQKTQRAKDRVRHGFFSYPPLGHQKSSLAQYPNKPRLFLHTLDVVCKHEQTKNNFRACNIFRLCFNNRKHDGNVLPVSYTCELLGHLSAGEKTCCFLPLTTDVRSGRGLRRK